MLGFRSASAAWVDVSARQRQLGRALRKQFEINGRALRKQFEINAGQSVPEQMLELLRKADARFYAATGHEARFHDGSTRFYSINVAIAIVGIAIVSWALYDIAWLALSEPKILAAVAYLSALAATLGFTAWLVEAGD
jgi:hypothetical protein